MKFLTALHDAGLWLIRNRSPLFLSGLCAVLVLFFLYFFYVPPATAIGQEQLTLAFEQTASLGGDAAHTGWVVCAYA